MFFSRSYGCGFDAEWNDAAVIQAGESFGREFFTFRRVMHRGRALQHALAGNLPEQAFAQRLLRHAPRIECAERTNQIWNSLSPASTRRRHRRMIEHCMHVRQIELSNVRVEP